MKLEQIPLDEIVTSPLNPRKNFDGIDFDGLCDSIAEHGVLQPIIVRPKNGSYEIVAGERRYRAMIKYAEKVDVSLGATTIPATIKEMDDDEAFEIMTIENLQRQDLSDYEEAASFKAYVDRKGNGSDVVEDLAGKTGLRPGYIRGRVAIMELPKYMLKAWEQDKLRAGHLFQLLRVGEASARKEWFDYAVDGMSVKELKRRLDSRSLELANAIFDKTECVTCPHNSSRQRKLFAIEAGKDICMKPSCFTKKLREALEAVWPETKFYKKDKLSSFVFRGEIDPNGYTRLWHPLPVKECKHCEYHVAYLSIADGGQYEPRSEICINPQCASAMEKRERAKARGEELEAKKATRDPNEPRVHWHGEHFREKFYQDRLSEAVAKIEPNSHITTRLALYALLRESTPLREWFIDKIKSEPQEDDEPDYRRYWLNPSQLMDSLRDMSQEELQQLTVEALSRLSISEDFILEDRQIIGDHIGVNLLAEWQPDEEYLHKKTKAELVDMGHKFGVFGQPRAQQMLFDIFGKGNKGFEGLKKTEMIQIFQDPDIDLSGVVPDEIVKGTIWQKLREQTTEAIYDELQAQGSETSESKAKKGDKEKGAK